MQADLLPRFTYHPPVTSERAAAHATVRGACAGLAATLVDLFARERTGEDS
ncbi:hypothetical protein [Streptomyces sp. NPDC054771]